MADAALCSDQYPFRPLDPAEIASSFPPPHNGSRHTLRGSPSPEPQPIVPVPVDAPPPSDRHSRHGAPTARWAYRDAAGALLGYDVRFEPPSRPKEILPQVYTRQGWVWQSFAKQRPLYGLDKLAARPEAPVLVVEGCKTADAAQILLQKYVVVSWPGGCKAVAAADWSPLFGRRILLWPDRDRKCYPDGHPQAGQEMPYAEQPGTLAIIEIASLLAPHCREIKLVDVSGFAADGFDLADWAEHRGETADALVDGGKRARLSADLIAWTRTHVAPWPPDVPPPIAEAPVAASVAVLGKSSKIPSETTGDEGNQCGNVPLDAASLADLDVVRAVAERLAELPPVVRERRMKGEAAEIGIGVRTLRAEIKAAQRRTAQALAAGGATTPDADGRIHLEVRRDDLPWTAREVAALLATRPRLFDRGGPARLELDEQRGGQVSAPLKIEGVVNEIHAVARPWRWREFPDGSLGQEFITLPDRAAKLCLDLRGWGLRPLDGIATAPLLSEDASIHVTDGYDPRTRMWCERMPTVTVPANPTKSGAEQALLVLRRAFRTFSFADSLRVFDSGLGVDVVDIARPAQGDESAALVALMTSVCRSSLPLAPGAVVKGPSVSGAGTGKGLLVRAWCAIANGTAPRAITSGGAAEELDKRITAALIGAEPVLFLDNCNGVTLKSDVLASAITERPAAVRPLGRSETVLLNPTAFVAVTGNGLALSEDLTRRFLIVELDAKLEDPEARPFKGDLVAELLARRGEMLQAVLTIWRWGRQNSADLIVGRPLGSFGAWGRWCRDPLLTLGCADPAIRVAAAKTDDPRRRAIADLFGIWWQHHGNAPLAVAELHDDVRAVADPQNRGRQFLAAHVRKLSGTRVAGFVLEHCLSPGKWTPDTYRLQRIECENQQSWGQEHRTHRIHGDGSLPMPPMPPMPSTGTADVFSNLNSDERMPEVAADAWEADL